jgi:GTPase SAR1 family protein
MKEVNKFGPVRCGTLKVLVLGSYMAGKTSIVLSLKKQKPSLTDIDARTISMDRFDWQVATDDGHRPLTVRFFDGGGQDTYAMTNQLFVTEQSLNMIVVDAYRYQKAEERCEAFQRLVGFYLDNVLDRNPEAVFLIVVAQADRVGFEESERLSEDISKRCLSTLDRRIRDAAGMRSSIEKVKTYMRVVCVCAKVNTAEHPGMSRLQTLLMSYGHNVELFPNVEYILPTLWHKLELHLEQHEDLVGKPYCTGIQMRKIASQLGLQYKTARFIVDYLHDIGSVLFYQRDPVLVDVVFHNLKFVISVFKAIFRHDIGSMNYDCTLSRLNMSPHRFQKLKSDLVRDGVATLSLVIALVDSVQYETELSLSRASLKVIVRLMEYFDLCYWLTERPPSFEVHNNEEQDSPDTFDVVEDDHKRRLLIPWLLDRSVLSPPAEVALYFGHDHPSHFVVVEASVCFRSHLPSALFARLAARCHRHQTYLRHWSRGALAVCGPLAMLLTEEVEMKAIVIKVKTPHSCEARRRIWQILLRVLIDLEELCRLLTGATREGHIILHSFSGQVSSEFHICLTRNLFEKSVGYETLAFKVSGFAEAHREAQMLFPDEETISRIKMGSPLSECLPEKLEQCLSSEDLANAAMVMSEKEKYKEFIEYEELKEASLSRQQRPPEDSASAPKALRTWQQCYGPFAYPCVLVESLCNANLGDIAVRLFGYTIPRRQDACLGRPVAATAYDARVLNGLVTRKEYIDVVDHLAIVFESGWWELGVRALDIPRPSMTHYRRQLETNNYSIGRVLDEMVREWYRRDGFLCTLAALLDKCERVKPNCRAELVSRIPKNTPLFSPPERLDLSPRALNGTPCTLCFDKVSMTASETDNWHRLARRLGIRNTREYESRYSVSDSLYEILEAWTDRDVSATVQQLLDACNEIHVRGAVEWELKEALDSKTGLCHNNSCKLCHGDK